MTDRCDVEIEGVGRCTQDDGHPMGYHTATRRYRRWIKQPPKHRLTMYGLTIDDFWELVDQCYGACLICRRNFVPSRQPVIDHDHLTGECRGLLCNYCNQQIGFLRENADWLARASAWLTSPPTRDLWPDAPRRHVNAPPQPEEK